MDVKQMASSECILCGDLMIESVQEPFVSINEDDKLIAAWEV